MDAKQDLKEKLKKPLLVAVCSTCGKPIPEKSSSNVTRYLSLESRCCCITPGSPIPGAKPDIVHHEEAISPAEAAALEKNLGDRYQVVSLLGRGGMGAVYKVKDRKLDQTFAIKVLNPQLVEDSSSVKRFEQEAKAASNLTHVNLAAVYDYGVGKTGSPYIVMDYLDGENLSDMIAREGFIDVPRMVDLSIQAVEAMAHAHSKGVIHRDIKPSNIIVEQRDGDTELVKLVDFGIAKVLPSAQRTSQMTQTGDIIGSPNYMSPEQCLGNKLDARSDIYEMGCVMYEMLTGIAPFAAENPVRAILRHVNEDAIPISLLEHDFNVPPPLERIVIHCLERDPDKRYQTSNDLLKDLDAFRDGKPVSVKSLPKRAAADADKKINRRKAILLGAVGLIGAALACEAIFLTTSSGGRGNPVSAGATDPYSDASRLDSLSYAYFMKGDYERAIPLLEFGIKTYKENGKKLGYGGEDTYLADQNQHVGKCFLALHEPAKAVPYYREALRLYKKFGRYKGGGMGEAITDYATVLRQLGLQADAQKMVNDFNTRGNIGDIP